MSMDAAQVFVEREDFEQAKRIITNIIMRDHLTIRVFETPDSAESPATALLEVWENGRKVREENYKLYLSPYTGPRPH